MEQEHSRPEFAQEVHLRAASSGSLQDGVLGRLRGRARERVHDDVGPCERLVEHLVVAELNELGAFRGELLGLRGRRVAGEDADAREGGAEVGHEGVAELLACKDSRVVHKF